MRRIFLLLPLLLPGACDERGGRDTDQTGPPGLGDSDDIAPSVDDTEPASADTEPTSIDTEPASFDTEIPEAPCESGIVSTFPQADATGVFYRSAIEVVFTVDESTSSTLTLVAADGTNVPGTVTYTPDGTIASFTPSDHLVASTVYTLTVDYSCAEDLEISFTTGEAGAPLADPSSLEGRVYHIDVGSGRVTEPRGAGTLLLPLFDQEVSILFSPTHYNAGSDTLAFRTALGVDDGTGNLVQDMCAATIDMPVGANFFDNPFMEFSATNLAITLSETEFSLRRIRLSGAFSPDASRIEGLAISGFGDATVLGSLLNLGEDPNVACGLLTTFGLTCVACSNGQPTCIELKIDHITADLQTGTLVPASEEDVNDVACAP